VSWTVSAVSKIDDYSLKSDDVVISHAPAPVFALRDLSERPSSLEIEALVASGDCCVTLATKLDEITESLLHDAPESKASKQLENMTVILLHLQRHYKIVRKQSDYRQ
jgi:hypothetical protein